MCHHAAVQFRDVRADDLATLARLAEPLQRRPDRHIVYLDTSAEGILAELEESTHDVASELAETDDGDVAGFLVADVDDELGRVWWLGPFVAGDDWHELAHELMRRCRERLPAAIRQEEMAVDDRFEAMRPWAVSEGFETGATGSWVLRLDADVEVEASTIAVRHARPNDAALVELHERLFPGTHTTGEQLISSGDETHLRLVAEVDGMFAGYVAVERQAAGDGYIDFLGVADRYRRRGLGRELVRAGVAAVRAIGGATVNLTVREDNAGARELYESLGFGTDRLIRPYRIGFSIG